METPTPTASRSRSAFAPPRYFAVCRNQPIPAGLSLNREVFERLHAYRRSHGIATWEPAIEQLLPAMEDAEVAL